MIKRKTKTTIAQIAHPTGDQTSSQMHDVVTNTMAMRSKTLAHSQPQTSQNHETQHMHGLAKTNHDNTRQQHHHPQQYVTLPGASIKGREFEDPATKAQMKAMAARALR